MLNHQCTNTELSESGSSSRSHFEPKRGEKGQKQRLRHVSVADKRPNNPTSASETSHGRFFM